MEFDSAVDDLLNVIYDSEKERDLGGIYIRFPRNRSVVGCTHHYCQPKSLGPSKIMGLSSFAA
ncbi:MAG: hypothetical protein ACI88A_005053 [Paraglaciecola sp.]